MCSDSEFTIWYVDRKEENVHGMGENSGSEKILNKIFREGYGGKLYQKSICI